MTILNRQVLWNIPASLATVTKVFGHVWMLRSFKPLDYMGKWIGPTAQEHHDWGSYTSGDEVFVYVLHASLTTY